MVVAPTWIRPYWVILIPPAFWACGGEKSTAPPGPPSVASVEVTPNPDTLAALAATRQFQATAKDANGVTIPGKTFTWASTDTMIARVGSTGLATAVRNGTTVIRATVDGVAGTATLVVSQKQTALAVRTQPDGANAGQSFTTQPVVEVRDAGGSVATNDNTTVVTVSLSSGSGSLVGTASVTAAAGIATFTNLGVGGTVGSKALSFTASGLASAVSSTFSLRPGPAAKMALSAGNNQTALAATALP